MGVTILALHSMRHFYYRAPSPTRAVATAVPLAEVVAAATLAPASAISYQDTVGTLGLGRCADVAVLELRECRPGFMLEDCIGQLYPSARLSFCWRSLSIQIDTPTRGRGVQQNDSLADGQAAPGDFRAARASRLLESRRAGGNHRRRGHGRFP